MLRPGQMSLRVVPFVTAALLAAPLARAAEPAAEAPASEAPPPGPSLAPEAGLWELGLFGGILLPPDAHELYELGVAQQRPFGDVAPEVGLRLAWFPWAFLGAELEGALMPATVEGGDSALLYSIRAHGILQIPMRITPFALAGCGTLAVTSDRSVLGVDNDAAFHWGLGAKAFLTHWLLVRGDVRHVFTARLDPIDGDSKGYTSHWELLAGLSVAFGRDGGDDDPDKDGFRGSDDRCPYEKGVDPDGCPPPAPEDTDGDGISDALDKCPTDKGEPPTGCPPADSDGDGILDRDDECPKVAGDPPNGCPDLDPDKDGVPVGRDLCPDEQAFEVDGCPDTDGDGIRDAEDRCPTEPETENGYQDSDGCPDELPKAIKKFTGAIRGITFESNSDVIRPSSFKTLNAAAKVLKEFEDVKLEVGGHTDDVGDATYNQELSERRANSVKVYLVAQGIDEARIRVKGYGEESPVASNRTKAGRAQNRRIEFVLIGRE